jgi:hypothetical protein
LRLASYIQLRPSHDSIDKAEQTVQRDTVDELLIFRSVELRWIDEVRPRAVMIEAEVDEGFGSGVANV